MKKILLLIAVIMTQIGFSQAQTYHNINGQLNAIQKDIGYIKKLSEQNYKSILVLNKEINYIKSSNTGTIITEPGASEAIPTFQYQVSNGESLSSISRKFNVSVDDILSVNDITTSNVLKPGITLYIPLLNYNPNTNQPNSNYIPAQPSQTSSQSYTVQPGDNLHQIATRFNTTTNELRRINQLQDIDRIYVGQVLIIPSGNADGIYLSSINPANNSVQYIAYTIKKGDSLFKIAQRYGTTAKAIANINNIDVNSVIKVGQVIRVPALYGKKTSQPETKNKIVKVKTEKKSEPQTKNSYFVKEGDTLHDIAQTYNLTSNQLRNINNLKESDPIYIGQMLKVPSNSISAQNINDENSTQKTTYKKQAKTTTNQNTINSVSAIQAPTIAPNKTTDTTLAQNKITINNNDNNAEKNKPQNELIGDINEIIANNYNNYLVQKGDSLATIAAKFKTDSNTIRKINGLRYNSIINIGDQLIIPKQQSLKMAYN